LLAQRAGAGGRGREAHRSARQAVSPRSRSVLIGHHILAGFRGCWPNLKISAADF